MTMPVDTAQPPLKVLLIEDDVIDQLAFTRLVKTSKLPYDYTIAGSLIEAQSVLNSDSFDVAVVDAPEGPIYLAIECNPRYNGSSYPTEIAERLQVPSWCSETLHTDYQRLADLTLTDLEFDPKTKTGVVFVNWGTIQAGKVTVLLAGTPAQQADLSQRIRQHWCRQAVAVN